jgi:hypothetical protein
MPKLLTRRTLIAQIAVTVLISGCTPPVLTELNEDSVPAKSLGYKTDAKRVDAKKFPSYREGQICRTCRLALRRDGALLPCNAYPGHLVAALGWCASFEAR